MNFIQHFISEELIYALGWTVMHSLWQGFLIAIGMALILQVLRKKSARVRYEVAAFSLFLVLASALCTFIWHFESAGEEIGQQLTIFGQVSPVDQVAGTTVLQGFTQSCIDYFNTHLPMIVLLWLIGVGFFILRLFGGLAYVQRLKYHRSTLLSPYWQTKVRTLGTKIPVKRTVQILESASVKVPMVIGYLKPFILLPVGAINQLDEKEIEAIIAHELAHVFRNDFLLNIFLSFIEVFFYYHPAVWWISGNVRLERENCCDDIAIRVCGDSLAYAKSLVRLQELNAYAPSFAMPFSGQKNQLLNRIKRILNQPQNRSNIMEKLTATCFLLIAIVFMSVSANTANDNAEIPLSVKAEFIESFETVNKEINIEVVAVIDTTPEAKKILEAKSLEVTRKDGEITNIIIDGKSVPKEEFEKYDEIITSDKMIFHEERMAPPAPPSPPSWLGTSPPSPPTPPAPLTFYKIAQGKSNKKQTITKATNDAGQTVIIVETAGSEPIEIIVDEEEDVIFIDGNELEDGDTAVIIDERDGMGSNFPNRFHFYDGESKVRLHTDSVLWHGYNFYNDALKSRQEGMTENNLWFYEDGKEDVEGIHEKLDALRFEGKLRNQKSEEDLKQHFEQANGKEKGLKGSYDQEKRIYDNLIAEKLQLANEHKLFLADDYSSRALFLNGQLTNRTASRIALELKKDGLIEDTNDFSFLLSNKKLKVNGKKQPKNVLKKYLELYEGLTGKELKNKTNYAINIH